MFALLILDSLEMVLPTSGRNLFYSIYTLGAAPDQTPPVAESTLIGVPYSSQVWCATHLIGLAFIQQGVCRATQNRAGTTMQGAI